MAAGIARQTGERRPSPLREWSTAVSLASSMTMADTASPSWSLIADCDQAALDAYRQFAPRMGANTVEISDQPCGRGVPR